MAAARKRPCSICHRWFRPHPRVGVRQRACDKPECQAARRKKTQAQWRTKNPDYATGYRLQRRSAQPREPEPLRVPAPLNRLPWDIAKDELGGKAADFLGFMGALLMRSAKDQIRLHLVEGTRLPVALRPPDGKDPCPPAAY
jgi:hypothetical protein